MASLEGAQGQESKHSGAPIPSGRDRKCMRVKNRCFLNGWGTKQVVPKQIGPPGERRAKSSNRRAPHSHRSSPSPLRPLPSPFSARLPYPAPLPFPLRRLSLHPTSMHCFPLPSPNPPPRACNTPKPKPTDSTPAPPCPPQVVPASSIGEAQGLVTSVKVRPGNRTARNREE